jgi:uncharacterized protein
MRSYVFPVLCMMPFLLSNPSAAQSFNCRYARTPDEAAICRNEHLSVLDEQLSARFYGLRNQVDGPRRAFLDRTEGLWLRSRMRCGADTKCIAWHYTRRIEILEHLAAAR